MGRRISISVLISYYQASKYGGFYKYIHKLIMGLADCGIKVHLIVKKDRSGSSFEDFPNINVHYIPTDSKILFAIYSIFALIKIIIHAKITIIHSHSIDEGTLSNLLKSVFRRKQVISLRANWWTWYKNRKENSRGLNRLVYAFYLIMASILVRRADGLIVTNTHLKKVVSRISIKKPVLLKQNIVDTTLFNPDQITNNLKKTLNIIHRPIIMYIGRLLLGKGLEYLTEAMNQLRNTYPDIMLILVGDGPHKIFLEELVEQKQLQKNVILAGYQKNIPEWLNIADIFVLPSLTEGSSNVLLEAMSMSRPVITTKVGNAPDIIHHLKNGVLVEPKNAEQIAEHIIILLDNKDLANTIGMNARYTVVQYFSQFSVDDIIALYNKIIDFSE